MKHLAAAPLPAIREKPEERAWTEKIAELLRALHRVAGADAPKIVLQGGTAARLGHGLSRPSNDIDLDLSAPIDAWNLLDRAASEIGCTSLIETHRKRQSKGKITLSDPHMGSTVIEADLHVVHDDARIEAIESGTATEIRNGIRMYAAPILAAQKIAMATEPGRRRRARDRYDITWWLHNHIEAVNPQQRIALDQAIRNDPRLSEEWHARHGKDPIISRVDSNTVNDALRLALDRDPVILADRYPEGNLNIEANPTEGIELQWRHGPDSNRTDDIAQFDTDRDFEQYMIQMQIWRPDEIPEVLEELTRKREQVRARSR